MKKKYYVLSFLLLFVLLTGGGITGSVPLAFAADSVKSITPASGACTTNTSQQIVVAFTGTVAMDPSSVAGGVSLTIGTNSSGVAVPLNAPTVSADSLTFTFTPATTLSNNTSYTVTVPGTVADASGTAISAGATSTFIIKDSCVPAVISHSPADGGTISATGLISATFSTPMSTSTVSATTFTVTSNGAGISGAVTMDSTATVATFTPSSPLALDTTYIATISKNVQSASGTSMAADVTWSFTANSSNFENTGVKCFIATAAYGSYLDPHVKVLRAFRDRYLLTNAPGSMFVNFYYDHSPAVARFISKHESLRLLTRGILTPVVYVIEFPLSIFAFIGGAILMFRRRKKRGDHV